ncbi:MULTISPECIES: hypothetical protein [unclassified Brevibacterium]|uniref:hypothetical protein n=1 Tax=unclassified Brevibacterium TaxID=2614124 RepID=UPI001E2910F0|nr:MULTISPECIES: hypothetical protein [unclassified Brevibacterium]MDK8436446.1 hypothetical protein [Brevibacterium sp. H-BE7]
MRRDRLNPRTNEPYGNCKDCEAVFEAKSDMYAHLEESSKNAPRDVHGTRRRHRGQVTNPTREERIEREVGYAIESATYDFCSKMDDLILDGQVTEQEVKEALRYHDDFAEAWDESMYGGDGE